MMSLLCCAAVWAVPAKPGIVQVSQSDGSTLTIQTVGNAFNHAILTSDGLMVERGADGDFYYTSSLTGLTAVRAHDTQFRTPAEDAFIHSQRSNLEFAGKASRFKRNMLGVGGSNEESGVPALGSRRIPIILVEFKDKKFNNTRDQIINAMLTGNESVGQYFRDQSNGLYEPEFEVFGIYTLSQNRQYYGGNSNGYDQRLGAMVSEACELAAADGVSFSPYDTNNDDYCDVVIVIYAGVGEAQASQTHPEAIWPCNWDLASASYYGMGGNGAFRPNSGDPFVNTFAVFNELHGSNDNTTTIDGIGTFCHEFGHCLGLPDFYDTNNGGHYGLGDWDIMCLGCYNNDGFTPPGYSAYEKVFMGWINYITPNPGTYYTLPVFNQKNAATDKALCIVSDLNPNEYFILENRRKQGWDRYAPGQGIMITHVVYNADRWWNNNPNNEDIQLMSLMNADNTWSYNNESTDLWPQSGKTEFTDSSTPAAKLNMKANGSIVSNAGYLGKPVTEMVINQDGTASFWYMKGAASNPVISVSNEAIDFGGVMMNTSATATFNVVGLALTGDVTLTLNDANGVFSINPTVISAADAAIGMPVTVTFDPVAITDYNATVTLSSNGADNVIVYLTGQGKLEGYTPVMLPADSAYINLTQFRADWTDQTPAGNVASYTLEVSTKPSFELLETADFTGVPNAVENGYLVDLAENPSGYLPDGWSATSYLAAYNGALILAYSGSIITPTYNLEGYNKVTVVVNAAAYAGSSATLRVSTTGAGYRELALDGTFTNYTVVLNCNDTDAVRLINGDDNTYSSVKGVTIYAGDMTAAGMKANETGGADYRLITDITDMFYTVENLTAEGTFVYKVKALYIDGTESEWSNKQEVTLFENGHGFELGDVDHDGSIGIADVTTLIDYLLDRNNPVCLICADVDENGVIDIADVTSLIDILLN